MGAPESLPEPNAKADADPALLYTTLVYHYPAYTYSYYTHPYVYGHYIGKRSAEPESAPVAAPESKADPAYLYGYYGYPYARYYGYGHPYVGTWARGALIPNPFTMVITVILTVTTEVTTDTDILMVTTTANKKDFNRKADENDD